jgi:competence protein ComEA
MFRKLMVGFLSLLLSTLAWAAVDVNKASEAELTTVKGIGPAISARIIEERKSSPFKDWPDFIGRVKGVGEASATRFSAEGLRVNGSSYRRKNARAGAGSDKQDKDARPAKEAARPAMPAKSGSAS